MRRSEAYDQLFRLKKLRNLNIEEPLSHLAQSEEVPQSVVDFIYNNNTRTVDDFMTVISKTKQFYENIRFNYTDNISKYVKAFLSLATHIEITSNKNPEIRSELCDLLKIDDVLKCVSKYITTASNSDEVLEHAVRLRELYTAYEEEMLEQ